MPLAVRFITARLSLCDLIDLDLAFEDRRSVFLGLVAIDCLELINFSVPFFVCVMITLRGGLNIGSWID